nr:hypothetical protein Itr_chr02CG03440 [Ipomoea trifida]
MAVGEEARKHHERYPSKLVSVATKFSILGCTLCMDESCIKESPIHDMRLPFHKNDIYNLSQSQ